MAVTVSRTRCASVAAGGLAARVKAGAPAGGVPVGSMVWGIAMVDAVRTVTGMIGPFTSATAAHAHAEEHCRGRWVVAPMLCLPVPDGDPVR